MTLIYPDRVPCAIAKRRRGFGAGLFDSAAPRLRRKDNPAAVPPTASRTTTTRMMMTVGGLAAGSSSVAEVEPSSVAVGSTTDVTFVKGVPSATQSVFRAPGLPLVSNYEVASSSLWPLHIIRVDFWCGIRHNTADIAMGILKG